MKRIAHGLFALFIIFFTMNLCAKPGFIVLPFAKSINLALNSKINVLITAQNNTTVNQTVTHVVPMIPENSGITGTVIANGCGFLPPGGSCEATLQLHSRNQISQGSLNVSVCSFNDAFCSRIAKSLGFLNSRPIGLFVFPTNPTIDNGTTQQFYAISLFSNDTFQLVTDSVTWNSSDTSKATISNASGSQGLALGVSAGTSIISATLGDLTGSTTLTVTPATLVSIIVTPADPSIAAGTTQQFIATGIFSDNSHQDLTSLVTWSSSNNDVATVSNAVGHKGRATGKTAGVATMTATFNSVSGDTNLTVTAATLTSIFVTPTNPSITVSTTNQFTATGLYSDNSTQDLTESVTWQTQSATVAIISNQANSKGQALGVGAGTTAVTATLGNISGSTNLQVVQAVLLSVYVVPTNASVPTGSERSFTALGNYSNNQVQDITGQVTWQSSNTNIATVSNVPGSAGLAKGIQPGDVIISATLEGISGNANLTVNDPTLMSITITPAASTIPNGSQQQFTAIGTYSDASTQDLTNAVTWASSSSSIATISNASGSEGLAQALAVGATTISASYNGVTGNTSLTVSAATLVSIVVTPANSTIPVNANQQFIATGTFSDASSADITDLATWLSSNTSVVTISNAKTTGKGLATGVSQGTATISALYNGITGSTNLTVSTSGLNCFVQRRPDSSSYWLGYDIFSNGAPMILNFSATGINLTQIIVNNGVFGNVQVLDQNQLYIGIKPDWVTITYPGFIDFHGPNYGPYEPFNSPIPASCQVVTYLEGELAKILSKKANGI